MTGRKTGFVRGIVSLAMVSGGLALSGGTSPVSAAASLTCTNPTLYNLGGTGSANGMLYSVNTSTGAYESVVDLNGSNSTTANGLGVTSDGSKVWALQSLTTSPRQVYVHDRASNTTSTLTVTETPSNDLAGGVPAGAVDPVTGHYYYGGYSGGTTMRLYRITTPTTPMTLTRYLTVSLPSGAGGSGDIAFDANGNLYMIQSGAGTTRLFRISAAQVAAGGAQTASLLFSTTSSDAYNGVAIDGNGTIWGEYTTTPGTAPNLLRPIDPNSGALGTSVTLTGQPFATDIAVCALPSSLSLGTHVLGRGLPSDQFTVAITTSGTALGGAEATTSGSGDGTQTATAGPIIAVPGRTYTLTLTPTGTAQLADYDVTYECVDQNNNVVQSGAGTSFSFTIPTDPGMTYSCSFSATGPNASQATGGYEIGDAGLGGGATCSVTTDVDRLPRMWVEGIVVDEPTVIYSNTYDAPSGDYMVLSGSWQIADGELKQLNSCGYDYTALLLTEPVTDFEFEATFAGLATGNQGGLVIHQSSDQTRSGAMAVDLTDGGSTLRWGSYDNTGHYVNAGSMPVTVSGDVTMKLVVHGTSVVIYLDGQQMATATAANAVGHVGLMTSVSAVAFKNVTLTALPPL